jgi:hypothetical protein
MSTNGDPFHVRWTPHAKLGAALLCLAVLADVLTLVLCIEGAHASSGMGGFGDFMVAMLVGAFGTGVSFVAAIVSIGASRRWRVVLTLSR